jgi:predicted XRE-type DNA-binding protein
MASDRKLALKATRTKGARTTVKARASKRAKPIAVVKSSGNVFADIGVVDADERLTKALLSRVIEQTVRQKAWTQTKAAGVLGIATSDMSDLMRGKVARFSQERLARFLNALDMDVVIRVGPRPKGKARAGVSVELVSSF